jgi:peptidylprolyl isomerase
MKMTMIMLTAMLLCGVSGFAQNEEFITTDSGLKYRITEHGDGELPKTGDRVVVHYTGKLEDGTKFDSSLDRNEPFTFELGAGQVIKGWDEGIALLHKGDKATFIIPPKLGYGSREMGSIPANSTLVFDVELVDILPAIKIESFNIEGKASIITDSGLKYYLVKEGTGKQAAASDEVTVHYTGYFEDGSIFDSSVKRAQPFKFTLGMGRVIAGWDEGIALMKIGDKMRFVIPYQLAYGEKGYPGVIPPKATLIFDVDLLEIK